jgi:ankyrin repeat protein
VVKVQTLPARPNLEFLKKLAKRQVADDRKAAKPASLAGAQLALARRYGFPSWRKLKAHLDRPPVNLPHVFRDVMKAIVRREDEALRRLLKTAPEVVHRTGPHPEWGGRPQPLHVAVETGNTFAFDLLLNSAADINGDNTTYDGWSPLMLAIHWKRDAMRDELIRRESHIDLITALMLRDDRRVAHLLKDSSSLAGPFANDATPLHFARTVKSARLLIARGVSVTAKDKYRKTAPEAWLRDKARSAGMVRLATSLGVDQAVNLLQAVEQGRLADVRRMLRDGADANSRHPAGSEGTLLHTAAWNGDLAMARLLVKHGADAAVLDREHHVTAAHFARHALKVFDRKPCAAVAEFLDAQITGRPTLV